MKFYNLEKKILSRIEGNFALSSNKINSKITIKG